MRFFNRRTVANIRRTENAAMDCPQWLHRHLNSWFTESILWSTFYSWVILTFAFKSGNTIPSRVSYRPFNNPIWNFVIYILDTFFYSLSHDWHLRHALITHFLQHYSILNAIHCKIQNHRNGDVCLKYCDFTYNVIMDSFCIIFQVFFIIKKLYDYRL